MTEKEAAEMLQAKLTCMKLEDLSCVGEGCSRGCNDCEYNYKQGTIGEYEKALELAIKALEEIQQYRAIGTVNDIKRVIEIYSKPEELITDTLNELYSYRKIGTVEECRAALEKLPIAEEAIRKLLCSEYGSSCQFCIHDNDRDAMCCKVGGSGSWCCERCF